MNNNVKLHDLAISLMQGETLVQIAVELPRLELDEMESYYIVEVKFDQTYEQINKLTSVISGEFGFSISPGALTNFNSLHEKFKERIHELIEDTLKYAEGIK